MKKRLVLVMVVTLLAGTLAGCAGSKAKEENSDEITVIEMGTYYNASAKMALDSLVDEFNQTVGDEEGIFVKVGSSGDMSDLFGKLEEELEKEEGARDIPDIFSCYASNALAFEEKDLLADLDNYFTKDELSEYVDAYIEEGRIGSDKKLVVFPVAKSTEVMTVNRTDWDKFAGATGAELESMSTWEGLAQTARQYYEWSGGRALFGRDAMSNYVIAGMNQLDAKMFRIEDGKADVSLDKEALKKLWDNYYLPYVSGYYTSVGKFRSDDMKTGELVAAVGSSSGGSYYAEEVTVGEEEPYPITMSVFPAPNFEGTRPLVTQQGAGMAVLKSNETKEKAAATFLKWFTQTENNIRFCLESAYLPVKKEANDIDAFEKVVQNSGTQWNDTVRATLETAFEESKTYELNTMPPFDKCDQCREVLGSTLEEKAKAGRAAVLDGMNNGMTEQEAVDYLGADQEFETWYAELNGQLKEILNR